jgi:O-acetyl-ADP-ribose deacetylase (regulator of RNase III)
MYKEVNGDLIELARSNNFDVICHGCNCFCVQGSGLAPFMVRAFGTDKFPMEDERLKGDINKLGQIDYETFYYTKPPMRAITATFVVVNAYTQYGFGRNHPSGTAVPLDYSALTLCMTKINHIFSGKHIGLPQIGCGLAGGDWRTVRQIIQCELRDCEVTVVIYNK